MKKKAKVSVCISVHNTEKYLGRCLDSLLIQTYSDLEIILVDNGSTDHSHDLMVKYQVKNPHMLIRIVQQNDLGLAQGRQTGIDNATGDYVTFLDADDFLLKETAIEVLYNHAVEKKVDIVEGQTIRDGKIIRSPFKGVESTRKVLKRYLQKGDVPSMLWMRLYKKSLFDNFSFPNEYVNNEDIYAFPCLLFNANKIYFANILYHNYSVDNEFAVMNRILNNKYNIDEIRKNREKILGSIIFIKNYFGRDINFDLNGAFDMYIYRTSLTVILDSSLQYSMDEVFNLVKKYTLLSEKEFIKKYSKAKNVNTLFDKIVSIVGLKNAIRLKRIIK